MTIRSAAALFAWRVRPARAVRALDLFAGHGWGAACQALGIEEMGVENWGPALATREANGMRTIYEDVWDGLLDARLVPEYDLLLASPPCQTFSLAGGGAGRRALDDVLAAIARHDYRDPARLKGLTETMDDRTALVLTPLAHVYRDRPALVVFEQVPPVLPVWAACAAEMRELGYSVWTGILQAEQYGVPQTRKRAFLIARRDSIPATPPRPTHSRYHPNDPARLDPDVAPWVTMRQAIGWKVDRPSPTVTGGGPPQVDPNRSDAGRALRFEGRQLVSNYGTGGDAKKRGIRTAEEPAATVTSKADRGRWRGAEVGDDATMRVTLEEVAALQTYPADFQWRGTRTSQFLQVGNAVPPLLAEVILRHLLEPPGADEWDRVFYGGSA